MFRMVMFGHIVDRYYLIFYLKKKIQENFGNTKGNQKPHIEEQTIYNGQ